MLKYVLRAVYCLFVGRLWWHSQYISAKRETQSGGLSREQFPTEHDSSSGTRTSTATVETEKQRVVDYTWITSV